MSSTPPVAAVEAEPTPLRTHYRRAAFAGVGLALPWFLMRIWFGTVEGQGRDNPWDSFPSLVSAVWMTLPWLVPIAFGFYAASLPSSPFISRPSVAFKMSCVALAAAAPLMREGIICYIVILPWHMIIAPLVAWLTERSETESRESYVNRILALALFLTAGYGTMPHGSASPVLLEDSIDVALPRAEVYASIAHLYLPMRDASPWWMRTLLPEPLAIEGGGNEVGSERRIRFSNGVLLARVHQAHAPESFTFRVTVEQAGREFFDHWLEFGDSTLRFEELSPTRTRIVHSTEYTPRAAPRWYFAPVERVLGHAIQGNLLSAYARSMEATQSQEPRALAPILATLSPLP